MPPRLEDIARQNLANAEDLAQEIGENYALGYVRAAVSALNDRDIKHAIGWVAMAEGIARHEMLKTDCHQAMGALVGMRSQI